MQGMARKILILADPGIDGAFAIALALHDPTLECLGLAATAGNVPAEQATRNIQILVEQIDPPRRPRFGAAPPVEYDIDGLSLHGSNGFGGLSFPCAHLHHVHPSDKLILDLVRQYPKEITIITLGPLTALASALDRDSELSSLVDRLVCVGGTWREPGDAGPGSEFHFYCDPAAARQVLHCGAPVTLLPLDATRKLLYSPSDLLGLPVADSPTCNFLRQLVPFGIGATSSLHGIEGFHLTDVLGIVAVTQPEALTLRSTVVDVETRGHLTRGMSVMDVRWGCTTKPNVDLAVGVDAQAVRDYMERILRRTAR
jgi:inosine-uridine nucleoside N-ribohydrolase